MEDVLLQNKHLKANVQSVSLSQGEVKEPLVLRSGRGSSVGAVVEGGPTAGLGIGYSQNYFHMVQRPLVMSRAIVSWLPPSQHYPINPRLTGEIKETLCSKILETF